MIRAGNEYGLTKFGLAFDVFSPVIGQPVHGHETVGVVGEAAMDDGESSPDSQKVDRKRMNNEGAVATDHETLCVIAAL